jgi:GNAT superfamily N-acetyltransferase
MILATGPSFHLTRWRRSQKLARMEIQYEAITSESLPNLKALLDASAGYDVDMNDEITYFDVQNSQNWTFAQQNGEPIGFIRCFPEHTWGKVELFVSSKNPAQKLALEKVLVGSFLQNSTFKNGFRLRFDLSALEKDLIQHLNELGFTSRAESFLHYECDLLKIKYENLEAEQPELGDAAQVAEVFKNLHDTKEDEARTWIEAKNIFVYRHDNIIRCAMQVYDYGDSIEINRLATQAGWLKKGFAESLITRVSAHFHGTPARRIILKVDALKNPARCLYQKMGFVRMPEKDQVWLSRIF